MTILKLGEMPKVVNPVNNTYYAEEGKEFRRIADGVIYGNEITLGYTYFINGQRLETPHLDTIDDFEQIKANLVLI